MASGTDVARAAKAAGFPDGELVTAVAVAFAESQFNQNAINRSNRNGSADYGVWQINSVHNFPEIANGSWRDVKVNAQLAHRVWRSQGWNAWSVYRPSDTLGYARYLAARPAAVGFVAAAVGAGAAAAGAVGTPGAIADGIGEDAQDALRGAAAIAKEPLAVLDWFTKPQTWERIASVVLGSALIIGGLYLLVSSTLAKPIIAMAKDGVKTAAAVAPQGKAAKAAGAVGAASSGGK